jgi:hypothetical protein
LKAIYPACAVVVAVLAGSAYFFRGALLPAASQPPVVAQVPHLDMPPGVIFIPAGGGICRMRALNNATGQIEDYGVVNCSKASDQNLDVWRRATSQDRFVEIGKSFRHEGGP